MGGRVVLGRAAPGAAARDEGPQRRGGEIALVGGHPVGERGELALPGLQAPRTTRCPRSVSTIRLARRSSGSSRRSTRPPCTSRSSIWLAAALVTPRSSPMSVTPQAPRLLMWNRAPICGTDRPCSFANWRNAPMDVLMDTAVHSRRALRSWSRLSIGRTHLLSHLIWIRLLNYIEIEPGAANLRCARATCGAAGAPRTPSARRAGRGPRCAPRRAALHCAPWIPASITVRGCVCASGAWSRASASARRCSGARRGSGSPASSRTAPPRWWPRSRARRIGSPPSAMRSRPCSRLPPGSTR